MQSTFQTIARSALFASVANLGGLPSAQSADYTVYEPHVHEGKLALETRLAHSTPRAHGEDKGGTSEILALEYGLTSWWETELAAEAEQEGADGKFGNIKWENILVPFHEDAIGVNAGIFFELEKGGHETIPNTFEGRLLLEKEIGQIDTTANFVINGAFGSNAPTPTRQGAAVKSVFNACSEFRPGIVWYGDFGPKSEDEGYTRRGQIIGPMVEGDLGHTLRYEAGAMFGVSSNAPERTFNLNVRYTF